MAVSWKVGYFADFEQVKQLSSYFADFEQVKKTNNKTPVGETGCLCICFLFLAIALCHWHSTLASQTCEGLHQLWALPWHLAFFKCLGIQFFNLLTCDLWDTMLCQRSPTLIPREAEDFPGSDNHSKHVPLPTYPAWLRPIYYNSRLVFIHVKTTTILLAVRTLIKNIEQQPH